VIIPDAGVPCSHTPYTIDGTCSHYDWGREPDTTPGWQIATTYSAFGYGYRNCTDYVAWRVNQEFGKKIAGLGNATSWDNNAGRLGLTVRPPGQTPEAGDIAQFEGDDAHPDVSPGHVAFVESVNADGSVRAAEYNKDGLGHFDERGNVRADHYLDINGANPDDFSLAVGSSVAADGHVPYAAVPDNKDFYTDEGWAYQKVGGAAFLIGRRSSLDTGKWGVPTGPVPVAETHDHEAGYESANPHPPRDYTTVYIDGDTQQWTFFHGRAYPVTVGELSDLGAVNNAAAVPAYGGRMASLEIGSPGQLPSGTVYRFAGQPYVRQIIQQPDGSWTSFWVTSQTAVDCLQLTAGQTAAIIPAAAQNYIEDGAAKPGADQPALCSFPPGWVLHGPGGVEQWRIEGTNSAASPYRRRYYSDQLTVDLNTSGNPQYIQMPTTDGLNNISVGPWMDVLNGTIFVNTGNGDEFVRGNNSWHKVPWPSMNACLGITPGQIILVPPAAASALPQGTMMSCSFANRMLAYAGGNYYVDSAGTGHAVPNRAVKDCIIGRRGTGAVIDITQSPAAQYPADPSAYCPYETDPGLNFVHEGNDPQVYVLAVSSDGVLQRRRAGSLCVPDAPSTQIKKYHLFRIPYGEMVGIPDGPDWFASVDGCRALPGDGLEVHQMN
jgi:surface antigen